MKNKNLIKKIPKGSGMGKHIYSKILEKEKLEKRWEYDPRFEA